MKQLFPCLVVLTVFCSAASAQLTFKEIDRIAQFEAVPSDPVFDLLGLTSKQIGQPGSVRGLLSSLTSAIGRDGKLTPAYAVTFAPAQLINPTISFREYAQSLCTRILYNSQFSFGTAASLQQDSSQDFGAGIRIVFFNSGDGRLDKNHIDALVAEAQKLLGHKLGESTADFQKRIDDFNAFNASVQNDTSNSYWNYNFLQLDIGSVWRASNSFLSRSAHDHTQAWLDGGWDFGTETLQLLGQAGLTLRNSNKEFYGPDSSTSFIGTLQLRVGGPNFRMGLGAKTTELKQGELGFASELRLSDDLWGLFTLTKSYLKDQRSGPWTPGLTIKTTMGTYKF